MKSSFALYDRSHLLTLENPDYLKDLEHFALGAFYSDHPEEDISTKLLKEFDVSVTAEIVAKTEGLWCGTRETGWLIEKTFPTLKTVYLIEEGKPFTFNQTVMKLLGQATSILKIERTLLNLLQRLCGIATTTHTYAKKSHPIPIAGTRKTLYGLLDKYALSVGGGLTHRLHLGDAGMFKENHLFLLQNDWKSLEKILSKIPSEIPFFTIEIHSPNAFHQILKNLPTPLHSPLVLLFDNFEPDALKQLLQNLPRRTHLYYEASGGITLDNLTQYAQSGVDVLSIGALTHSVKPIDLSLKIVENPSG